MNRRWQRFLALCLTALLVVTQLQPARAGFSFGGFQIPTSPGDLTNIGKQKAEEAAYAQISKALDAKAAIHLDQKAQSFKKVDEIQDFHPTHLTFTSLEDLEKPLPPGDYSLDIMSFCTQWSIHVPGHNSPYTLGRADGARIGIITAFLIRGQIAGLSPDQLHNMSFQIQAGAPLSSWSESDRALVHRIIPEFEEQLQGDLYEQIKGEYENAHRNSPVSLPDFDQFVSKVPLGRQYLSLRQAQKVLTDRSIASQEVGSRLYDATAEQDGQPYVLPAYTGNKTSAWGEIEPGVYGRYTVQHARAGGGSDGINLLELRITPEAGKLKFLTKGDYKIAQGALTSPGTLASILFGGGGATIRKGKARPLIAYPGQLTQALVSIAFIVIQNGPRVLRNTIAVPLTTTKDCNDFLARIFPIAHRKIPKEWWPGDPTTSKNFCGWRWRNPENELGNYVRIDEANPTASEPGEQVDHVHVKSGQVIGWDGNPIPKTPDKNKPEGLTEAHIPLSTWQNWSSWDRP